ncbi:MAG: ABC transporter permease [Kangiellaceae bacterium]|nr:ABC transporter permease [Kangiellaceae bacterium]MCW8997499.1 ABC transporter permease [Kangiellaceae bacterium]MCW9016425.1 ABC transporter permease [Kangiellaceae bacterium]
MLSHIAKLIWNRKRSNLLIITEVAITFGVLFAVIYLGIYNYKVFNTPLGFEWKNTWNIRIDTGGRWNNETDKVQLKAIAEVLRTRPEIKSADVIMMPLFVNGRWRSVETINGHRAPYKANMLNHEAPKNLGVELVSGRWFGPQDDGQNYQGVMVNQRFVDEFLDSVEPVGFEFSDPGQPEAKPKRIVGIFKDFRQQGEFSTPGPYMFFRYNWEQGDSFGLRNIMLKFDKPQPASYEKDLHQTLKQIAPSWEFNIQSFKNLRQQRINEIVIPMTVMAVVVAFLLIMVAMGLFGVLWQNINRRIQEIGLRRAIGASENSIRLQIIGELIVLAIFGMAAASIFIIQVPLLNLIEAVTWGNFVVSMLLSISAMLLIVIICALYPSHSATKLSPAVALHYE